MRISFADLEATGWAARRSTLRLVVARRHAAAERGRVVVKHARVCCSFEPCYARHAGASGRERAPDAGRGVRVPGSRSRQDGRASEGGSIWHLTTARDTMWISCQPAKASRAPFAQDDRHACATRCSTRVGSDGITAIGISAADPARRRTSGTQRPRADPVILGSGRHDLRPQKTLYRSSSPNADSHSQCERQVATN